MKKTSLVIFISYLFILFSCSDPNKDSESFDNKEQENNTNAMVPNIITQPSLSNYYFTNGQILELCVVADVTDNGVLTYQWYKNEEPIKNANQNSYTEKLSVTENENAKYYCEITNTLKSKTASVKSEVVTIYLINDIFSGTDSYTLNIGKSETIELYKKIDNISWKSSDENIVKVENGTITAISIGNATVTATFGNISKSWSVTVNNKINASIPKYSPTYNTLNINADNAFFFVKDSELKINAATDDNGILTYQWFVDNKPTDIKTEYYPVTIPGTYHCEITNTITGNNIGQATAKVVTSKIVIEVKKPAITEFTYNNEIIVDNKAFAKSGTSLKIKTDSSDSTAKLTYQWYKDNQPLSDSENNSYMVTEYGTYHCVISNIIAGEEYKQECTSDIVEILENNVSFQDIIDKAENKSSNNLTINDYSFSYGEEQIDFGDDFGEYIFTGGDAVLNKKLTISSSISSKLLDNSKLSVNVDGVKLNNLSINTIEATASLGNGALTIRNSKLNNLLINGGGYNSIHMEGNNTIDNASFGKKDINQYARLSIESGSKTKISYLNFNTSGIIQGDVTVDNIQSNNWNEASINCALDLSADVVIPDDVIEIYFGTKESEVYKAKFKILLKEEVKLDKRFLNQAGNKLWGDDFYGYSWLNIDNNKIFDIPVLTESKIKDLLTSGSKTLKLSCDAKEKAIFLPHIIPTEHYLYKDNNFIPAFKQFHLTHYSKLYESLADHTDTIDIDDPNEVELETLLLDPNSDEYSLPNLQGYENAFSVIHDSNRNVYTTIAFGNISNDNDLTRYGHLYIKMLSEENISEKLIEEKDRTIKMESKFALPDYLTDLSYLGDSSSDYAGVNAPVSFHNVKNNFKFNNNFVASFARLAINNDGSKLYLLTGADGADITGETYKLCVYDLTSSSLPLIPTEINVSWESGVPQAMALSEDGTKLYVAEIKYNEYNSDKIFADSHNSHINIYTLNANTAVYSKVLLSYENLPETTELGCTSSNNKFFFGKTRIGVSDMKTGNNCLYITSENVNKHISNTPEVTRYSRGALTIVDLTTDEIKDGKQKIGWSSTNIPTNEYSSFYGPTRILAVEPRKIIILDDGNTDDEEYWDFTLVPSASGVWTETFLKQKNRVAVYDLEKETLNFANMGSDFGLYSTRINGSF